MPERDVETIAQRAKEKFTQARPPIISDSSPQFVPKDFREFIRVRGMTRLKTSPCYPSTKAEAEIKGIVEREVHARDKLSAVCHKLGHVFTDEGGWSRSPAKAGSNQEGLSPPKPPPEDGG